MSIEQIIGHRVNLFWVRETTARDVPAMAMGCLG